MSLRVWLPLTKDLKNQGLDDVTITNNGATFNSTGKLGGCYYFNNAYAWLPMDYSTFGTEFSVAFWYKIDTAFSGNRHLVCLCNQYGWPQLKFTCAATSNSTLAFNIGDGSTSARPLSTSQIIGSWQHICFTFNNKIAKVYVNGVQAGTAIYPINPDWSGTTKMGIGGAPDGHECAITLSLNDVRIYNHCLSPMEIKEISQGLILHYPLNRNGWGQENLSDFSSIISNWIMEGLTGSNYQDDNYGNVIKLTSSSANKRMYHNVTNVWESGQIYTVSFLAKADTNDVTCEMSRSLADFTSNFSLTTEWKEYQGIITSTATASGGTLSFRIHQSGKVVYITKIKLEKGSIVTPWCPNSSDALATTMGLNDNIEYDTSGYGNNGTKIGTFDYDSDTPKYNISTVFNGVDNCIQVGNWYNLFQNPFTINVWFKKDEIGSKGYETLFGAGGGFEIDTRAGNSQTLSLYLASTRGGTAYSPFNLSQWYMVTMVSDGTNEEFYVDGILRKTIEKKTIPNNMYRIGAWSSDTSQNFKGQMSDFRVYATALSAEDIKSLYNNSAYIDNQGNIYGAVYEEV